MIKDSLIHFWDSWYRKGRSSGAGSSGDERKLKIEFIKENCADVKSILDIGCGDFQVGKEICEIFPEAKYVGLDISENRIERNCSKFKQYRFEKMSDYSSVSEFDAELILCIDVLFHQLDDSSYQELLQVLKTSSWKYLVLTEYDDAMITVYNGTDLKHRHFEPTVIGHEFVSIQIPYFTGHKWIYIFTRKYD